MRVLVRFPTLNCSAWISVPSRLASALAKIESSFDVFTRLRTIDMFADVFEVSTARQVIELYVVIAI